LTILILQTVACVNHHHYILSYTKSTHGKILQGVHYRNDNSDES